MITLTLSILMLPSSAKRLQRNIVVAACCYDDTARWMSADTAPGVRTKKIRDIRIKLDAGGELRLPPAQFLARFAGLTVRDSFIFCCPACVLLLLSNPVPGRHAESRSQQGPYRAQPGFRAVPESFHSFRAVNFSLSLWNYFAKLKAQQPAAAAMICTTEWQPQKTHQVAI